MKKAKTKVSHEKGGKLSYQRSVVVQIIELAAKEIAGVASFGVGASLAIKSAFSKKYKKK